MWLMIVCGLPETLRHSPTIYAGLCGTTSQPYWRCGLSLRTQTPKVWSNAPSASAWMAIAALGATTRMERRFSGHVTISDAQERSSLHEKAKSKTLALCGLRTTLNRAWLFHSWRVRADAVWRTGRKNAGFVLWPVRPLHFTGAGDHTRDRSAGLG